MRLLHLVPALPFVSVALAWTTYTVPHSGGGDDTPALTAALSSRPELRSSATIVFQAGLTYNLETPIIFPRFENVIISVQGNLTFANDVEATQASVASSNYNQAWICFDGGSNVTLQGTTDPTQGWIYSDGQKWWDAMANGMVENRPRTLGFFVIDSGEIGYLKLSNNPAWTISTGGSNNIHVHDNTILAISNNENWPMNTDGFAIGGTGQLFENNHITNGDDCVIVNGPADNITIRNTECNGGASFSVGSAGTDADIKNILFENCVARDVYCGATVKAMAGNTGVVNNIVFKNIEMIRAHFPIYVTQNYLDQEVDKKKEGETSSTSFESILFENFTGTINDAARYREGNCTGDGYCPYSEPGATGKEAVYISVYPGYTEGILVRDIHMTTESGATVMAMCDSSEVNYDVGFKCCDCAFQPTSAGTKKRSHHLRGLLKAHRKAFS